MPAGHQGQKERYSSAKTEMLWDYTALLRIRYNGATDLQRVERKRETRGEQAGNW